MPGDKVFKIKCTTKRVKPFSLLGWQNTEYKLIFWYTFLIKFIDKIHLGMRENVS